MIREICRTKNQHMRLWPVTYPRETGPKTLNFMTYWRRSWTKRTSLRTGSQTCPTLCCIADSVVRRCRTMNPSLNWRTSSCTKLATAPTVRVKKDDTSTPTDIGRSAKDEVDKSRGEGDQRIVDLTLQALYKGTGKEKWSSEKGHNGMK